MRLQLNALVSAIFLVSASACGGPAVHQFTSTSRAPGADGTITVSEVEGGNRLLKVKVEHLPPPGSIVRGGTVFVVWFQAPGGIPMRAGLLGYDEQKRKGAMEATSPGGGRMTVLITVEAAQVVAAPSEAVIVKRDISS